MRKKKRHVLLLYVPAFVLMLLCAIGWIWIWMSASHQDDTWYVTVGFWCFPLLSAGMAYYLTLCRITIDERGIGSRIPGSKSGNGFIPWENVRAVGIFHTPGGERLMFVSTIPQVWEGRNLMRNNLPLDRLIKLGYSRRRVEIIKQYYSGEIMKV